MTQLGFIPDFSWSHTNLYARMFGGYWYSEDGTQITFTSQPVVDALKRLSRAYPMLETKQLLDKASALVAQHVMFGKPAKVVIDEIEKLFAEAYAQFVNEQGSK